jgi:murein DD-endopeptidase MepM/ murein hydrolase activator NlpD
MRGVFTLNNLYGLGGVELVSLYEKLSDIPLNESLKTYFRSLGAIFFQFNMLAGIIIAGGLLIYSRIAFLLSLYGFYTAYLFYMALGGNFQELNYSYVGFNYILTAIAIGGFFLIPSKNTFLWLLVLIPVVTLITLSLTKILAVFSLPVYALPFNIVVLLFIYALKFRLVPSNSLREVVIQQNSPEENLYSWHNQKSNIHNSLHIPFRLPFHGAWSISQGYNGSHTHRDEWQHALDFVVLDDNGKQFKNAGDYPSDYYCFGKTVLAPAGGTVEEVIFDIPDNDIGKINTWQNWGNSVVIKHADYLYSCCSHLKNGSVNVKPGDKVKTGQKIGEVGNSGRSPYPHLHFQFQAFPYIGSKTMPYPLSYYLLHSENKLNLHSFSTPRENDIVENVETNPLLVSALHLIPGRVLSVRFIHNGKTDDLTWEVYTNSYNNSYILEKSTGAIAWFVNDNTMVYFTQYRGRRTAALYYFYSAFHKSLLAFQQDMVVQDELPLNRMFRFPLLTIQDFFAPFYIFLKSCYQSTCIGSNTPLNPTELKFENKLTGKIFSKIIFQKIFTTEITGKSINVKTSDPKNEVQIEILLH